MKKGSAGTVWGMLMIVGGILLAGRILHWFEFELFFAGWWTLFLIIPSAVNFMTGQKDRSKSLKGLIVGVMLLMAAQGFIEYRMLFPLLIAVFLILTGGRMMVSGGKNSQSEKIKPEEFSKKKEKRRGKAEKNRARHGRKNYYDSGVNDQEVHDWRREADKDQFEDASNYSFEEEYDYYEENASDSFAWNDYANREEYRKENYGTSGNFFTGGANHNGRCACTSIFMGKEINYTGEVFEGAVLSCIMGAIDLNLSGAVIYHDVMIEVILIMGGIDIIVPKDVRVVVQDGSVLGSVDNHVKNRSLGASAPTVYVKTTCILGGMDIM